MIVMFADAGRKSSFATSSGVHSSTEAAAAILRAAWAVEKRKGTATRKFWIGARILQTTVQDEASKLFN
jgi:hypothetical protein